MSNRPVVVAIGYVMSAVVAIAIAGFFFAWLSHLHTEDHQDNVVREQSKTVQVDLCSHVELEANRVLCLQAVNGR